jgi:hypothetical protein
MLSLSFRGQDQQDSLDLFLFLPSLLEVRKKGKKYPDYPVNPVWFFVFLFSLKSV